MSQDLEVGTFAKYGKDSIPSLAGHIGKARLGLVTLVISVTEVLIRTPTLRFNMLSIR